ncbi:MAG: ABC transporter ATP-binding protein [Candidatus Methylomirabilales bacterium]
MAQALLTLQEILVRYGEVPILHIPSLAILPGEVLAIIGPNGSGKSTLLRVMGLLEQPTEGKVSFRGDAVTRENALPLRRRMASVFQEPLLLNTSVYKNASMGLKLRLLDRYSIEQRVRPWLERLGIAHLARRPARSLSGGEAQRASLARAFALRPELLLLDEPFSALDPPTRERLLLDLKGILQETGVTTVFVTHDRNEAFMIGDRVAVLINGRLLQVGPTTEVFAQPASEEVAQFVGVDTKIPGVVEKVSAGLARVCFDGGSMEVVGDFPQAERVILCLRPEDITLCLPGGEDLKSSARNRLTCKVIKITPWGAHYRVAVKCGESRLVAFITRPSFLDLNLREGEQAVASFKATAVHVIRQR